MSRPVDALGRLDAAVANAGVLVTGSWDSPSVRDWRAAVEVNLIGVWNTCLRRSRTSSAVAAAAS
jgi:NAD(P)-dependent dehydrogenase (short-subunit alcohol dehydrogenase family)